MKDRPAGFDKRMLTAVLEKARICIRLNILFLGLAMMEGCQTFDTDITSTRSWDRPIRWEVGHDWMIRPETSNLKPGDNFL